MAFNLLKFINKSCAAILLFMMSVTVCYSRLTDNRGFPVQQQSQGSSFISPNSLTNTPQGNYNNNIGNYNNYKTHGYRYYNVSPSTYYYNPGISPYYYYYDPGGGSYYNSYPSNYNSLNSNYNQNNVQTTVPKYDSSSLPDGTWITERDGSVPDKAFVFQIINGAPTYYCRVQYKYTTYFGVLSPNIGCYIQDDAAIVKFGQYDVLISPN